MSGNACPPRPHLTTPRLTLNALTPADCGDYAALCRDVRRNRWWGYDYREEQPHPPEEWFLQENHPSRHMLAACMDPTGEDETYFYFEKCIQNENDMHMDILSE